MLMRHADFSMLLLLLRAMPCLFSMIIIFHDDFAYAAAIS